MRNLPQQQQMLTGVIEYEFDVSALLNALDSIASVDWAVPSELNLVNSLVEGTKVRGFIEADATAKEYETYWVSFTVNSVGAPTPISPTLSFEITIVKRIVVKVI